MPSQLQIHHEKIKLIQPMQNSAQQTNNDLSVFTSNSHNQLKTIRGSDGFKVLDDTTNEGTELRQTLTTGLFLQTKLPVKSIRDLPLSQQLRYRKKRQTAKEVRKDESNLSADSSSAPDAAKALYLATHDRSTSMARHKDGRVRKSMDEYEYQQKMLASLGSSALQKQSGRTWQLHEKDAESMRSIGNFGSHHNINECVDNYVVNLSTQRFCKLSGM